MKKTLLLILLILFGNLSNLYAQQVTITTSTTTIEENGSATITATLDAPSSKDVVVSFETTGTASYDKDFKTSSALVISTVAGGNGSGSSANQLYYPRAIFVDTSGNIYISDLFNHRIQKWTPGALTGITVAGGNGEGSADNQLYYPEDVYVDTSGNIYISDSGNHRIQKWAPGAVTGITVAGGNGPGSAANQLSYLRAIFVDALGNIYISDLGNHRIQKWTMGASTGITVAGGNGSGSAANQLNSPTGLFVDTLGNIYISDSMNNRIQKWTPGALAGITVAGGNGQGSAANQLNSPDGIFVDTSRNIYISDYGNNRIQKWTPGALTGITVAGGNGPGSAANQLNPSDVFVETSGNIYISDSGNNRIQKYQFAPQIVISAGQTAAQLTISGIVDTMDENEETIVLQPSVINATLATTDLISITLTDNNDPPTVSFTFSASKIAENSSTDVTLTATLSNVSGKDVDLDFLMEGTATETGEYTVSSKHISIPANKASGSISISTKGLDDTFVEVLESIVFKVSSITNATASADNATLYLDSDDSPKVTVTASPTTIAEHESATLTATIDAPSSRDVTISLESTGTAVYDQDFKINSAIAITTVAGGNGAGSSVNQLNSPSRMSVDAAGNVYVVNGNTIQKWASGGTVGTTVLTIPSGTYFDFISVDANGNIYIMDRMQSRIEKWVPGATSGILTAGGNGSGSNANQFGYVSNFFVDTIGNIYIADRDNYRVQKWTLGATTGITVAGGHGSGFNANQLGSPQAVFVDASGNIYVNDGNFNRIQKWTPNALTGTTILGSGSTVSDYLYLGQSIEGLFVDGTGKIYLMSTEYTNTEQVKYIKKWDPVTRKSELLAGSNGSGSAANQLNNSQGFTLDSKGNLYIADTGNHRVQKYQLTPQIVIKAGQISAQLTISGKEDDLETEGTEQIVLKMTAQNTILDSQADVNIALLDNTRTLTLKADSPFTGLENGAVSWGDYDRDGDQDVAVMGTGNSGAVTKLYENRNGVFVDTNQNFTRLYGGDISWVDLNKDGWIDLVVSGFNATPQTKVYINNNGTSFTPSTEYGLPQLYSSKMAWGDLDNDGDIDLAISGIDKDEKYVFNILYKEDNQNKFVIELKTLNTNGNLVGNIQQGFRYGDLKIVDIDLDGDNDIIYNGENYSGQSISNTIYNSYINTIIPNNYNYNQPLNLKNSVIEVAKMNASQSNLTIISSGVDSSGANQFYASNSLAGIGGAGTESQYPKLKSGDIAVADYNNDGTNDILFTGEDSAGIPTTKLYFQNTDGNYKPSTIVLQGLRNSTANWVDYDTDGDLDLFLTGTSETGGVKSLLYVSDIANKKNTAPAIVSGLIAEDLGNGKIKFKWNAPKDDYSINLGYVIKLGTTPGGTELSNTESNLTTGARLITKQAPIYTGFYEMQLDPGKYYWSVQAVDTGLKGGAFSAEDSFTLTYDWKILNQGGIVDRSIAGIEAPVIKLGDLDNDNDLDLIYANSIGQGSNIMRFDGKRLIADETSSAASIISLNNVSSVQVGDITGDGIVDLVMDTFDSKNFLSYLPNGSRNGEISLADGLFKSKIRIIDMNNDGQPEVVVLGMSTNTLSGLPKLWIYEYDKSTNLPTFKKTDASAQIAPLANASFDLGDIDKDQDIDLIISGFSASDGLKCIIYENITEMGGSFTLKATENNLVAIKDGTTDFIDFDGDGDLDAVFTGTSITSDVFEIYINKLNEGITTWPRFSSGLIPMRQSKIDLGDFNGDGYCDLLYSGLTGGGAGNVTKLSEYSPGTGAYKDSAFDVSDIQNAEVEFGDIDGDKDLDFVITGKNKNYILNDPNNINGISKPFIFRTYLNVRNDSAKILVANTGKNSATEKSFSSKTATYVANDSPSVPGSPDISVKNLVGTSSKAGTYPIELSWLASIDDHTPSEGLTYAIKVGTTSGGEEILSANANVTGTRKISGKGNVEHNKKWRLSLPVGTYYWSVQAIDASYSGSEFSASNKFEITAQGLAGFVNNAPVAVADQITVSEGGTVTTLVAGLTSVLANDTDTESNTLITKLVSGVTNGTLTLDSNGTFSYVHNGSETTSDSFSYKANDGTSDSNTVTVVITITPVNDAPVAVADQIMVAEGGTAITLVGGTMSVLTNDTDAENNTLTTKLVSGVTNGILTLNSNGTFSYVHNGSETTFDSFTYKTNDGTLDSNVVTVIISITPVNDAPIAIADQITVAEGGSATTLVGGINNVLTNDTDAENNTLTAKLVSGVTNGTLTLNSNGTFSYAHNGSETTSDSFVYKTNDGNSDSNAVTTVITIIPVNDAPIAVMDQILVLQGGTATSLIGGSTSVLINDTDAENNTLTASLVLGVTNGTLTLNPNGTFNYAHNDSGTTTDSFTYKANDGTSDSNTVTVVITITMAPAFALPSTNFTVEIKDETCTAKSNGEINITAVESYPYVATINGKIYNFVNNSLAVPNLTPGSYAICITIPGKVFEQCYTVNVAKGKTITGKLRAATNKVSVEIVEGTAPYQIFVNGKEQFETESTTFSVDVKKGDLLEVKTAKSCEGIYSKGIGDLLGAIALYPNPTSGSFEINLPTSRKEVVIDLYTAASQLISQKTYPVVNERVQLNLGNEPSGVYIVKIYLDTPKNLTIIKN